MTSLHSLHTHLIEKALALTESNIGMIEEGVGIKSISIEHFCYYLLSPLFLARYAEEVERGYDTNDIDFELLKEFSLAIYLYQSGDKEPLEDLLKKITI